MPTPEGDLLRAVKELLKLHGWRFAHFGNTIKYVRRGSGYKVIPDKDAAGFPDILAVKGKRLIFAELKAEKGKPSEAQLQWMDSLRLTGLEVYLWYPSDLDEISNILSRK